jgi:putative thiamine transport system ATP-binding protein
MSGENGILRLQEISIALNGRTIIDIDTAVAPGEILTVSGSSGSGKSTLLAFVAGFADPAFKTSGRIVLNGRDITHLPAEQRQVGVLFQDALLFPHMSVGENLLFAIPACHAGRALRRQMADAALEEAGLAGFFDRDPATLSGGQKTRAALMRVLLSEPRSLLLDEPFTGLDAERRRKIRGFTFAEAHDRNLPVVLVTHDRDDAVAAGGPVFELD